MKQYNVFNLLTIDSPKTGKRMTMTHRSFDYSSIITNIFFTNRCRPTVQLNGF